jgi:tetratricopeptide (TPR) repeat protein
MGWPGDALVGQGRYAAADSALEQWRQVAPNLLNRHSVGFNVAFSKGDFATARARADSLGAADDPGWRENSRMKRSALAVIHGRLAEAERGYREVMDLQTARGAADSYYSPLTEWLLSVVQVQAQPARMVHLLDSVLALHPIEALPPYNRPYLLIAMLYAKAGEPDRAERLIHEWQQAVSEVEQRASDDGPGTLGMVALARGRYAEAIAGFRASAAKSVCGVCWQYETGQAFEGLQQPDSALASYEAVATRPDTWWPTDRVARLLPAYSRLGEMYEARGDRAKALEYYGRFAELWKDAGPELQPRVAEVRKRIAELAAKER